MPYFINGQTPRNDDISHIRTKVRAYASDGLFARGEAVRLGDFVTGVACVPTTAAPDALICMPGGYRAGLTGDILSRTR